MAHYCMNETCDYKEISHKLRDGMRCPKCDGSVMSYYSSEDDKQRLDKIINNAVITETVMYADREELKRKREYILSGEDYNWLIQKVKENL